MSKSLNEQFGLFEGSKEQTQMVEFTFADKHYAPVREALKPRINLFRGSAAAVLVFMFTSAGMSGLYAWLMLMIFYFIFEWIYRSSKDEDFILGELQKFNPEKRYREGDALFCHDVAKIAVHHANGVTVTPTNLIVAAKTMRTTMYGTRYDLMVKLLGSDHWIRLASGVDSDMEDRIREMNPKIPERKWWQLS